MAKRPKRPRDKNQLGKLIVDLATENIEPEVDKPDTRNQHAVELSKLGASKGGKARAKSLSGKERKEIAKKAAKARWGTNRPPR
jgi:hypothetical protein